MNVFTYMWILAAVFLLLSAFKMSKEGKDNRKALLLAFVAIVFVILNILTTK